MTLLRQHKAFDVLDFSYHIMKVQKYDEKDEVIKQVVRCVIEMLVSDVYEVLGGPVITATLLEYLETRAEHCVAIYSCYLYPGL